VAVSVMTTVALGGGGVGVLATRGTVGLGRRRGARAVRHVERMAAGVAYGGVAYGHVRCGVRACTRRDGRVTGTERDSVWMLLSAGA